MSAWSEAALDQALAVALRAADAAEHITLERFAAGRFHVEAKADATPVTEADREAELAIRGTLRAAYPEHAFFGEEYGREGSHAAMWLIDPIDGTKSFVRGYPMFSTQIALMVDGELVLGVSAAGAYGERAWARRGGGAWLSRHGQPARRLAVSDCREPCPLSAVSTGNLKSLAADPKRWAALADIVQATGRIRGYGDFLHYHLLAQGSIDLVIESDLNILDIAALVVIVREAGGCFTTLEGGPIQLDARNALAGPAELHAWALARLNP